MTGRIWSWLERLSGAFREDDVSFLAFVLGGCAATWAILMAAAPFVEWIDTPIIAPEGLAGAIAFNFGLGCAMMYKSVDADEVLSVVTLVSEVAWVYALISVYMERGLFPTIVLYILPVLLCAWVIIRTWPDGGYAGDVFREAVRLALGHKRRIRRKIKEILPPERPKRPRE